jgi:hypothetical protein
MGLLTLLAATTITTTTTTTSSASSGTMMVVWGIYFLVIIIALASLWKLFVKAGKPGWASIVPIYNIVVELEIVGRPAWWVALMFVPFVNLIIAIIVLFDLAKAFGKGSGYAVFMLFLPFIAYPMLAFGDAKYVGVNGQGAVSPQAPMGGQPMQPMQPQQPMAPTMTPPQDPTSQMPPQQPLS